MSKQSDNYESANQAEFKLNEPYKQLPSGMKRESVKVALKEYPEVERRLRLNRLLLMHDPDVAKENLAQIGQADLPVLRRIAQESVLSGNEPAIRRNAISVLGRFPTVENLNLLADLARYGEDPYVRGAALTALADTGIALALPLLKEGLAGRDSIDYRRAQQGLLRLGARLGSGRIKELLIRERRKVVRSRLNSVLDELAEKRPAPEMQRRRQTSVED